jgi:3'-phosphoadenosine 5'-phosphosulfate sulfotransferase (PAPS reductase)/FAD synthetase
VIDRSEEEVWEIIRRHRIRPHPAYYCGWGRLSCAACVFGRPDQWASLRAIDPERFDLLCALEMEFGHTVHRGWTLPRLADRGTPYPAIRAHPDQVALALGHGYPASLVRLQEGEEWVLPAGAFSSCGGPS